MGPSELDMKIDRKHLSRERKSERERDSRRLRRKAGEDGKAHFLWPPRAVCIADRWKSWRIWWRGSGEGLCYLCLWYALFFFFFFPSIFFSSVVAIKCQVNFLGGVSDASPCVVCVTWCVCGSLWGKRFVRRSSCNVPHYMQVCVCVCVFCSNFVTIYSMCVGVGEYQFLFQCVCACKLAVAATLR